MVLNKDLHTGRRASEKKNRLIHYINTDLLHVIGLMRIVFDLPTHMHSAQPVVLSIAALLLISPNFPIYFSFCCFLYIYFFVVVIIVIIVFVVGVDNTHL